VRYDPATYVRASPSANTDGSAVQRSVTTLRLGDRDGARSRQAAELDVWEDEGGTTASQAPESPCRHGGRHFDEFSG
jgi:hypothetical protein